MINRLKEIVGDWLDVLCALITFPGAALFGLGLCWLLGSGGLGDRYRVVVRAQVADDLACVDVDNRTWSNLAAFINRYQTFDDSTPHRTRVLLFADDFKLRFADLEIVAGSGLDLSAGVAQRHSGAPFLLLAFGFHYVADGDMFAWLAVLDHQLNQPIKGENSRILGRVLGNQSISFARDFGEKSSPIFSNLGQYSVLPSDPASIAHSEPLRDSFHSRKHVLGRLHGVNRRNRLTFAREHPFDTIQHDRFLRLVEYGPPGGVGTLGQVLEFCTFRSKHQGGFQDDVDLMLQFSGDGHGSIEYSVYCFQTSLFQTIGRVFCTIASPSSPGTTPLHVQRGLSQEATV